MNDYAMLQVLVPVVGFQWIDGVLKGEPKRKRRLLVPKPGPLFHVLPYHLFEDRPALFRTFADLEPDEAGIQHFADEHGWLGLGEKFVGRKERPLLADGLEAFAGVLGEPLDTWQREILWMHRAVRLWDLLKADSTEEILLELEDPEIIDLVDQAQITNTMRLTGAATYDPEGIAQRVTGRVDTGVEPPFWLVTASSDLRSTTASRTPEMARHYGLGALWVIVNRYLADVPLGLTRVEGSGHETVPLVLFAQPQHLLAGLWLQLALAIQGNKRFLRCRQCQKWFQPPAKALRESTAFCSTKCRVREYRQRVDLAGQLAQKGKSTAEIARELKTDADTVRGWIKGTEPKRSKTSKRKAGKK